MKKTHEKFFHKHCKVNDRKWKLNSLREKRRKDQESNDQQQENNEEKNIYSQTGLEDLIENDQIDSKEHGFMIGYIGD